MKKATKLKAFMLSLIMTALLLPMTSFAQQTSDDFFRVDDAFNDNRAVAYALTGNLANDDFGAPLGSGLLILTAVGAGYAIARRKRSFRKGTALMLTALLLLGMTDCKKKIADPIMPSSVRITLNVDGDNDGSKVNVDPYDSPMVTFESGDKVLVGYNGRYVGTLTHNGSNFSGDIEASGDGTQKLYFYFVGNKQGSISVGDASCTVNISDQSTALPVLSFSASNENYNGGGTYTASLHNQCALVKFTMANPAGSVQVGSMHTEATISFATPGITPTATTGSVRLNSKSKTEKWAILLPQDAVDAAAVTVGSENLTVDVPAITRNAYITDIPAIANTQIDISQLSYNYEAQNGEILYGTLGGNYKITIAADATVTLNSVTINGTNNSSYAWAGITCVGNATIILKDGSTNNVKGFYEDYPGIYVPAGSTLIIKGETSGTGILNASSNDDTNNSGAGIGGGWNLACGNIEIQGGVINATGSTCAAGIGSNNQACGNITISGGTVTATGGGNAAGIGGGFGGGCGDITIASTVTRVTATKGDGADHSIGRGRTGSCGTVTIGGVEGAISTSPYTYPVPAPVPTGAINGLFSVSSTKQVYFSKGNLQATCSSADADGSTQETWTWQFASNQYEVGTANSAINGNGSVSTAGTVDLFCWSTSATYYGISTITDNTGLQGAFVDWGGNIGSGWYTLSKEEWDYLFSGRTNAASKYGHGSVNGVNGMIILPDSWTLPDGLSFTSSNSSWTNSYTTVQWSQMESAGAVFLPAAGIHIGTDVYDVGNTGLYWSSSVYEDNKVYAFRLSFNESFLVSSEEDKSQGLSVRLVKDAN